MPRAVDERRVFPAETPSLTEAAVRDGVVTAHHHALVAQATGYPEETLSLDMGMEADLGIDSIKRVEILSMLSKRVPGAPSVNPEKLGGLRTLKDVADFIGSARADASPMAAGPRTASSNGVSHGPCPTAIDRRSVLLEVVAQLTGYPLETLALEMEMEADLGIDSIKRVEILSMLSKRIPGAPSVNPEKLSKLRTLEQVLQLHLGRRGGADERQRCDHGYERSRAWHGRPAPRRRVLRAHHFTDAP